MALVGAAASACGEPLRVAGKAGHGVGVEHDGALAGKRGQDEFAGCLADADARPDRERVKPAVGKKLASVRSAPSTGRTMTARLAPR